MLRILLKIDKMQQIQTLKYIKTDYLKEMKHNCTLKLLVNNFCASMYMETTKLFL